jgi:hypothetical protein
LHTHLREELWGQAIAAAAEDKKASDNSLFLVSVIDQQNNNNNNNNNTGTYLLTKTKFIVQFSFISIPFWFVLLVLLEKPNSQELCDWSTCFCLCICVFVCLFFFCFCSCCFETRFLVCSIFFVLKFFCVCLCLEHNFFSLGSVPWLEGRKDEWGEGNCKRFVRRRIERNSDRGELLFVLSFAGFIFVCSTFFFWQRSLLRKYCFP